MYDTTIARFRESKSEGSHQRSPYPPRSVVHRYFSRKRWVEGSDFQDGGRSLALERSAKRIGLTFPETGRLAPTNYDADAPDLDQKLASDSMYLAKDSHPSPDKRVAKVRACDAAQSCED